MQRDIRIGDVFLLDFTGTGSVQSGRRPAVVFQNNVGNQYSPNLVVFPLTSRIKKTSMPTHVLVRSSDSGLTCDSIVLCENPQCVSKEQLGKYLCTLQDHYLKAIAAASILASSAISFMDLDAIIEVWHQATELNTAS